MTARAGFTDIHELMNYASRIRALRRLMSRQGIESMLIHHLADVRYLCGFTGSNAFLALTANRAAMFTDGRYIAQAREETRGARVIIAARSARDESCHWLADSGVKRCSFDPGLCRCYFPDAIDCANARLDRGEIRLRPNFPTMNQ